MTTSLSVIENFLSAHVIAVVGVSRNSKKFGYAINQELTSKGYKTYPINPNVTSIDSDKCYPNLKSLPEHVDNVVIVTSPKQTEEIVHDIVALKIKKVWIQQGAQTESAIRYCKQYGIEVISGECILMYVHPVNSFHRVHRWIWKLIGKYPK